MKVPSFAQTNYTSVEKVQQHMLQINKDIEHLVELSKDPKKSGELIMILDPTVDKINGYMTGLQSALTSEFDKKIKEFEFSILPLNTPEAISKSVPSGILSDENMEKLRDLINSDCSKLELEGFKKILVQSFKDKLYEKLEMKKLEEQNLEIRKILDKIRQTLMV